jgi:hypothetical protein
MDDTTAELVIPRKPRPQVYLDPGTLENLG